MKEGILRSDECPSDPSRPRRNPFIQNLERAILVPKRCEDPGLAPERGRSGSNSLRILAAAGPRIRHAEGLHTHRQQMAVPYCLQSPNSSICLSLA